MEDRIKLVMSQVLGVEPASIGRNTNNTTVRRWDSLGHMNLCAALEEEFGVAFSADQVVGMTSYDAVVTALKPLIAR